jgi:hypothetical protein
MKLFGQAPVGASSLLGANPQRPIFDIGDRPAAFHLHPAEIGVARSIRFNRP